MKKKIEISKKGNQWFAYNLKTGKLISEITIEEAEKHWHSGEALFADSAMQEMARRVMV